MALQNPPQHLPQIPPQHLPQIPQPHITFQIDLDEADSYENFIAGLIERIGRHSAIVFARFDRVEYLQIALVSQRHEPLMCLMRRSDLYVSTFTAGNRQRMHKFSDIKGIPDNLCHKLGCNSSYESLWTVDLKGCTDWNRFLISVENLVHGLHPRDLSIGETEVLKRDMVRVIIVIAEGVRNRVVAKALTDSKMGREVLVTDRLIGFLVNSWGSWSKIAKDVRVNIEKNDLDTNEKLVLKMFDVVRAEELHLMELVMEYPKVCGYLVRLRCNHLL